MHIETYDIFLLSIELKHEILMLIGNQFLMMSDSCLKLNICIFGGCNNSKMNKLSLGRIKLPDYNNEFLGLNLRLLKINITINSKQLKLIPIILRQPIALHNIQDKLIQSRYQIKGQILLLFQIKDKHNILLSIIH